VQNFLGGGKVQVSPSLEVLGSLTRLPNSLEKNQNSRGEEGLTILGFRGYPGSGTFWNFQGKEGLKCSFWPMVGYGNFLESPNN